jgi:hypothetical protein
MALFAFHFSLLDHTGFTEPESTSPERLFSMPGFTAVRFVYVTMPLFGNSVALR